MEVHPFWGFQYWKRVRISPLVKVATPKYVYRFTLSLNGGWIVWPSEIYLQPNQLALIGKWSIIYQYLINVFIYQLPIKPEVCCRWTVFLRTKPLQSHHLAVIKGIHYTWYEVNIEYIAFLYPWILLSFM